MAEPKFRKGDKVRVSAKDVKKRYQGLEGVVQETENVREVERVTVEINRGLGQKFSVTFEEAMLTLIERPETEAEELKRLREELTRAKAALARVPTDAPEYAQRLRREGATAVLNDSEVWLRHDSRNGANTSFSRSSQKPADTERLIDRVLPVSDDSKPEEDLT